MRRQDFLVNARLVIIALKVRRRRELDEVFVAGGVLGEQAEMMINVAPAAGAAGFLFQPRTGRDINLAADDGFDAFFARGLVKIYRTSFIAFEKKEIICLCRTRILSIFICTPSIRCSMGRAGWTG